LSLNSFNFGKLEDIQSEVLNDLTLGGIDNMVGDEAYRIIVAVLLASAGIGTGVMIYNTTFDSDRQYDEVSIACWNIENFGPSNVNNDDLLDYYVEKLSVYDIFIIQEVSNKDGTAIVKFAHEVPEYDYVVSARAGYSATQKEQYAVFYNERATLVNATDWTGNLQNQFSRPPFQVTFTVDSWTFTIFTIHTDPNYVRQELDNLYNLVGDPEGDTIIIGDLNADGTYYNEVTDRANDFVNWEWKITNEMDTTVASGPERWTYDRIIINDAAENNFIRPGIMDDVVDGQSDHYLVYGVFNPDESNGAPPTQIERVIINELELNPDGSDGGSEWVELYNLMDRPISLDDWILVNNDEEYFELSGIVDARSYSIVTFPGMWLDNSDEGLILYDPHSREIDRTPIFSDDSNDENTWSRSPNSIDTDSDTDWDFQMNTYGYSNSEEDITPYLLINEFELNPAGSDYGNEWVELYNPSDHEIPLIGWGLKNNDGDIFPLTGAIDPGDYLVIIFTGSWLDNSDEGITLTYEQEEIDSTPIKMDSHNDERSWQRIPNGQDTDSDDDWLFQTNTMETMNV
jgi:hypothetical protein